jgi:hypothetical protein
MLAILACAAAACGSDDRGITQPTPPTVVFVHNTLNSSDNRSSLDVATSWTAPYEPGFTSLRPSSWDDFTSATAATIRAASWQGGYCNRKGPGLPLFGPPRADSIAFHVSFFHDDNGRPQDYAPQYEVTLSSAEAHEQLAFDSVRSDADCAYFDYTAVLPTPFAVTAGTRYWLLIRADLEATGSPWGWRVGRSNNGISVSGTPNSGMFTVPRDLAFSLTRE